VGVADELERARALADRVVRSYGLELFDVQLRRESLGWVLRVVIDRPARFGEDGGVLVDDIDAGIGIAECQQVSEDLGTVLDVEDPLSHEYTLEVSSPGLDRPLRDATDYRRFAGRLVKLVAREPVDGQSHFEGRLAGLDGDTVLIEVGRGKQRRVPLALVSRARLDVEF
jgi:ribosome maturation factor RimP